MMLKDIIIWILVFVLGWVLGALFIYNNWNCIIP